MCWCEELYLHLYVLHISQMFLPLTYVFFQNRKLIVNSYRLKQSEKKKNRKNLKEKATTNSGNSIFCWWNPGEKKKSFCLSFSSNWIFSFEKSSSGEFPLEK